MQTKKFLGALDHERIVKAIGEAEARSRGEVRVHVSGRAVDDPQPSPLGPPCSPPTRRGLPCRPRPSGSSRPWV